MFTGISAEKLTCAEEGLIADNDVLNGGGAKNSGLFFSFDCVQWTVEATVAAWSNKQQL